MTATTDARLAPLARLLAIVDRLRAPDGCPWDRKQTVASMAKYVLEEGHELVDAIERNDDASTVEEAGDLLMVIAMIARIASEEQRFDLARAAEVVADKLVRRHPHVFGDAEAKDAEAVLVNWEAIKQREREDKAEDSSALAGLPLALPALQRAQRTCEKAVAAGFSWDSAKGALAKVREELGELEEVIAPALGDEPKVDFGEAQRAAATAELGDLLLAGAFLGSYIGLDPEAALRSALRRFEARFRLMEQEAGGRLKGRSLEELVELWGAAKRALG